MVIFYKIFHVYLLRNSANFGMCTCDLISLVNLHSMLVWLHLSILQTGLNLDLMYNHSSVSAHGIAAIVLSSSGQSHCGIHVAMILVVVSLIVVFMLLGY